MSHFKSEKQHKENLKALGRTGALIVLVFALSFVSIALNVNHWEALSLPWFPLVIIAGGVFIVPRVRRVMKAFEDNLKT